MNYFCGLCGESAKKESKIGLKVLAPGGGGGGEGGRHKIRLTNRNRQVIHQPK